MSLPGRSVLLLNRKNVSFHLFRFRVYIVSQIRNSLFIYLFHCNHPGNYIPCHLCGIR